jgi:hypothetical protein
MGGQRAEQRGGVPFSGLMFYNQEGEEEGGLVYRGKAIPGGQDADVTLTFDQYRHDQNVYLHHEQHKDATGPSIDDDLKISTRRLFVGGRRGVKDDAPYDDAGMFIKNRWGRDAIKLYVDYESKPHLEIYDQLGKSIVYELKLPK